MEARIQTWNGLYSGIWCDISTSTQSNEECFHLSTVSVIIENRSTNWVWLSTRPFQMWNITHISGTKTSLDKSKKIPRMQSSAMHTWLDPPRLGRAVAGRNQRFLNFKPLKKGLFGPTSGDNSRDDSSPRSGTFLKFSTLKILPCFAAHFSTF